MERLTIRNRDGSVSQPMDLRWADALEKLADYEDTGLEPGEVKSLEAEWRAAKTVVEELRRFKAYFDSLYGQGLEIANWHMNGDMEPFDNFYDSALAEMEDFK